MSLIEIAVSVVRGLAWPIGIAFGTYLAASITKAVTEHLKAVRAAKQDEWKIVGRDPEGYAVLTRNRKEGAK